MTVPPDLVLLHGALGASSQLSALGAALHPSLRTHTLDFEGPRASMPRGELAVLPGTPHPIERVELTKLTPILAKFFGLSHALDVTASG